MNLHSIMLNLVAKVVRILQEMLSVRADNVIRTKVVAIGLDGCEKHLDYSHLENYTKAQLLAKKNIKEHGGTAKAAAANKAAMKLKIKKAYMAKKKKK